MLGPIDGAHDASGVSLRKVGSDASVRDDMSDSPLRSLVASSLPPFSKPAGKVDPSETHLAVFEAAADVGAEAVAGSATGLDHFAGERILASVFMREQPRGHDHRLACAITDRRTCLSGWSSMTGALSLNQHRFSLLHADLQRVEAKNTMLTKRLALVGPNGPHEMLYPDAIDVLARFYQTLATRVPPEQRVEPPTPFVVPGEDDPSGALGAARALWVDDPAAREMLESIDRGARNGSMEPATAQDLAGRVVLAHRTRAGGPGMYEGRWISPMSAQDFGHSLVEIYGPPMAHAQPQPGVDQLDFQIDPRRDPLGAAATALGVASYIGLGVGFRPGRALADAMTKRKPVTQLRVMFADRPGHTGYRVFTPSGDLAYADSMMAHAFHRTLGAVSYRALEARCRAGWHPSYQELFGAAERPATEQTTSP